MSHRILESREAYATPGERLFLRNVQQFKPRRGPSLLDRLADMLRWIGGAS